MYGVGDSSPGPVHTIGLHTYSILPRKFLQKGLSAFTMFTNYCQMQEEIHVQTNTKTKKKKCYEIKRYILKVSLKTVSETASLVVISLNVKRVKWLRFKRVKSVRTTLTE